MQDNIDKLVFSKEQLEAITKIAFDPKVVSKLKEDRKGYLKFPMEKKNGSKRWIHAPHYIVKSAQSKLLQNIPTPSVKHFNYEIVNGFCPGRSIVNNAIPHIGKPVVLSVDLKNFFPSFTPREIRSLIKDAVFPEGGDIKLALAVMELVTTKRLHLPQGAPTSPMLANWLAVEGDKIISSYCADKGLDFTRYADDLTFSTHEDYIHEDEVQELLNLINSSYGKRVKVAPNKVKFMRRCKQQRVTGIVVNSKTSIPRARKRKLRAFMHHAGQEGLKKALSIESKTIHEIWGEISFLNLTNPELANKYIKQLQELKENQ